MPSTQQLAIAGYRQEPVPNTYVRNDEPRVGLAVFLPGFGYTCDMPLFYYAGLLLLGSRMDILRADYVYARMPRFSALSQAEQRERINADAASMLDTATTQVRDEEFVVVAKSIGTRALAHWLTTTDGRRQPDRIIWLTPLLGEDAVRNAIRNTASASLIVIGTADPHYDEAALDELAEDLPARPITIPDADHGLDVGMDPLASIQALERTLTAIRDFQGEELAGA